jgi:hypothetical protein
MRATILSAAAGAALLLLFTGCCSNCQKKSMTSRNQVGPEVARSQSPAGETVTTSGEEWCDEDCFDENGRCRHCWGHGCCHCRCYRVPRNLSYPPPGELPGIVQYPYYTCKGPDCFFAEPNPIRPR